MIPVGVLLIAQGLEMVNQKIRQAELTNLQLKAAKEQGKLDNSEKKSEAEKLKLKQAQVVATLKEEKSTLNRLKSEGKLDAQGAERLAVIDQEIDKEELKLSLYETQEEYFNKEAKAIEAQSSSITDLTSK